MPTERNYKDKYIRDFLFEEDSKPLADIPYTLVMKGKRTFGRTDYGGKTILKVDDNEEQIQVTLEQPLSVDIR